MPNRRETYNSGYQRRRTRGRSRSRYEERGGNGSILIMIGLMVIGLYFYMDQEALAKVEGLFLNVRQAVEAYLPLEDGEEEVVEVVNADILSTEAHIVKALAYTFAEDKIVKNSGETIWYNKYYKAIEEDLRFVQFSAFNASNGVTYRQALTLLEALADDSLNITLGSQDTNMDSYITLKDFLVVYEQVVGYVNEDHGLDYETIGILGTISSNTALKPWEVATSEGIYTFEGLVIDPYKDYTLKVLTKNNEILGVVEAISAQSTFDGCYIKSVEDGKAVIQIGELTFHYEAPRLTAAHIGNTGSIIVGNSQIIDFALQTDVHDTILKIDDGMIEFEKAGVLAYDQVLVYNSENTGNYKMIEELYSGINVSITESNGYVTAIKVVDDSLPSKIRVLLSSDGLGSYTHDQITVESEGSYQVVSGDQVWVYGPDDVWDAAIFSWEMPYEKVTLIPNEGQPLKVSSMTRREINPKYDGTLEIYREDTGYQLINVVPLETYVAGVVPSEMPTSYGIEAAKVQAVAARSYALAKARSASYVAYGAQVDDTVATQVYNMIPANDTAYEAVEATKGEILLYEEEIISGNFFATSSGYTANFGETWAKGGIFPTSTPVYLVSRQQYTGEHLIDSFDHEEDALDFFMKSPEEVNAFDSDSPWFRWQVDLDGEALSEVINHNIYKLTSQYPDMVKVQDIHGDWGIGEIETVGAIESIEVTKRGEGGNIMEMIIEAEEETIKISTEYLIRSLLAPIQIDGEPISVIRGDGSEVDHMTMLPSAFFSMDITYEDDLIDDCTIYGGGFGHGVGMSQDGVKGMVELGYTYREVLKHFYASIEIRVM